MKQFTVVRECSHCGDQSTHVTSYPSGKVLCGACPEVTEMFKKAFWKKLVSCKEVEE